MKSQFTINIEEISKEITDKAKALTAAAKYCRDVRDIHFSTNSFKQK